ncbi:MAG: hypothetical protein WCT49_05420 [Candidatus Paceibacterota bacterium]|jgi:hypothetical protein|nr:hypothetical protein [Candidatus Paceibacterota bacterium]
MKTTLKTFIIGLELICLVLLVSFSGYGISSLGPDGFAKQMGLAIGMTAGVKDNGYNTLAQSLKERDAALTERERLLSEKEAAILNAEGKGNAKLSFLVIGVGSLLLGLISLNFYLDAKRRKEPDHIVTIRK